MSKPKPTEERIRERTEERIMKKIIKEFRKVGLKISFIIPKNKMNEKSERRKE